MKHNIRDPKTGRFIKKSIVCNCNHKIPLRDPVTGRFMKKEQPKNCIEENHDEHLAWKDEFDRAMELFNKSMAQFNAHVKTFSQISCG